ncbi:MAG TPA: NUDIX domain-containing protein [Patescibacteria group bacterium]|nr:NUDIX domain-containing protein [Patescibacteria group bacterium]
MKQGRDYVGVGVGAMIFNDRGELLLCKRGQAAKNERGCWECPGGGVEFGETMVSAVIREVQEELGIKIRIQHQLNAIDHLIPADGQHWVTTPFVSRIISGKPSIMEPLKCDEIDWFPLDALPEPLSIATRLNLVDYQAYRKSL